VVRMVFNLMLNAWSGGAEEVSERVEFSALPDTIWVISEAARGITLTSVGIMCGWSGRLNSPPLDIRSAPTLSTFKNMLKTYLFTD